MYRFPRLHAALDYAADAHSGQSKKGADTPYLAHLLGVCSLVLDHGGTEDQAIAALLHDVIEDAGAHHEAEIDRQFGAAVARIVRDCTDATLDDKAQERCGLAPLDAWRARKERYIAHLATVEADSLLVSGCDKLYNARLIGSDLLLHGPAVFDRFTAGRDGTLWYYQEIGRVLRDRLGPGARLAVELDEAIGRLERGGE